jgi:hypothetical protein
MKTRTKWIITACAVVVLAIATTLVLYFTHPKPVRFTYDQFEQTYLKKAEIVIRPNRKHGSDVLLLFTADKDTYYTWRNWPLKKNEEHPGGLIFPEAFFLDLYDAQGFDITTLKIPSLSLDHREDADGSFIVLGVTHSADVSFSDAKKAKSFRFSFQYEVK